MSRETLLETGGESKRPDETCNFCGTSSWVLRYKPEHAGCVFCRRGSDWGRPIEPKEAVYDERAITRRWIAEKDRGYPGGFTQFCKDCLIDEVKYRKEAK